MTQTHIGTNSGSIIQKELLSAEKSLLICSPGISLSIGEKIFDMVKKGIEVKVITSEKGGSDSEKTNQLAIKLLNTEQNEIFTNLLNYKIVEQNKAAKDYNEKDVKQYMKWDSINLQVNLNIGNASHTVYTCDFTHDYIDINADYRN